MAVVLAAGEGRRFAASGAEGPKQLATVSGEPLVLRVVCRALDGGFDEVAVVQGAIDLRASLPESVTLLANRRWPRGIATSLQAALRHAQDHDHEAVVVGLGDQPGVTSAAWRSLRAAPSDPPIAVAAYAGRRGNPVRLHRSVWPLLPTDGDEGARTLMQERPELVGEVPCSGQPGDIDTLEDLDRWS